MAATLKVPEILVKFSKEISRQQEMVSKAIPLRTIQNTASIVKMASKATSPLIKKYL